MRSAFTLALPSCPLELLPFQRVGVASALMFESALIAGDPGTGKTPMALAVLEHRLAYPAIIVCPASMKYTWADSADQFVVRGSVVIEGREPIAPDLLNADVIILNYDILEAHVETLTKLRPKGIVFDESHYLKERGADRTVAARKLIAESTPLVRLCLSATPMKNRPRELAPQLEVLGKLDEFGGFWKFLQRYTDAKKTPYGWNFDGASNTEELGRKLRDVCMIRFRKEDVLKDLPPKRRANLFLAAASFGGYRAAEASLAQLLHWRQRERARLYRLMRESRGVATPEIQASDAQVKRYQADALLRITKLRTAVGQAKYAMAIDWISDFLETGQKLVVFAIQKDIQARLVQHFEARAATENYRVVHVLGNDSALQRRDAEKRFQTDPDCKLIICSHRAAQEGLTLTAASTSLTIEFEFSPAGHVQAEDRIWRISQVNAATVWYLVAKGTIDDDMRQILHDKMATIKSVVDDGDVELSSSSVYHELCRRLMARYPDSGEQPPAFGITRTLNADTELYAASSTLH